MRGTPGGSRGAMSSRVAVAERFASLKKQASGALNMQKGSPRAEVTLTIPVEELRQLFRTDVKAVVKAELEAAKFPGPNGRRRFPNRLAHGRRRRTGDNESEPMEAMASPWDLGGDDDLGSQVALMPMEVGKRRAPDVLSERRSSSWRLSPEKVNPPYELLLTDDVDETVESQASSVLPNMGCCMRNAIRIVETLSALKEPPRTGCLADLVKSSVFQTFFALVIGVNAAFMIFCVNNDMNALSSPNAEGPVWAKHADMCFLSLYCIELVCKLGNHRLFYFWNDDMAWNWLDFLLIVQSLVEATSMSSGGGRGNTWMRTIRLFRVAKVLRILRFVKVFTQLHLIMSAILGSLLHLFWSILVFAILFLMFSLYFVSSVATYLKSVEGGVKDVAQPMVDSFGSVQVSMRSLFMALSGGTDWVEYYDALVPIGAPSNVFLFFIAFSQIALLNIVTGIFVDNALKIAEPDVQELADEHFNQDQEYAKELKDIIANGGTSEKTRLSKDDFEAVLKTGKLGTYFRFLGIDPIWSKKNLPLLFERVKEEQQLMDGEDENAEGIETTTFVDRCMALRGNARSTEIMDLQDVVSKLQLTQELILEQLQQDDSRSRAQSLQEEHLDDVHGDGVDPLSNPGSVLR